MDDRETLLELNRDYIRSVQTSDVRRFDELLADARPGTMVAHEGLILQL